MKILSSLTILLAALLLSTGCVTTNASKPKPKPYELDKCLVINKKLEGRVHTRVQDGQTYKFCCVPCVRTFDAHPDPWIQKYREETGQVVAIDPPGEAVGSDSVAAAE